MVAATFLPVSDYGDLLYINAPARCLQSLNCAMRFVTSCKCSLIIVPYMAELSGLHWLHVIFHIGTKVILGLLPQYLCGYVARTQSTLYVPTIIIY